MPSRQDFIPPPLSSRPSSLFITLLPIPSLLDLVSLDPPFLLCSRIRISTRPPYSTHRCAHSPRLFPPIRFPNIGLWDAPSLIHLPSSPIMRSCPPSQTLLEEDRVPGWFPLFEKPPLVSALHPLLSLSTDDSPPLATKKK